MPVPPCLRQGSTDLDQLRGFRQAGSGTIRPDQVWVSARVDTDGDPSTKHASDLVTETTGPFSSGQDGIKLTLEGSGTSTAGDGAPARVSGTIEIDDESPLQPTDTVFVIVRRAPSTKGPPLAAVKMTATDIPGPFSLGDDDVMMGGAWPEEVWIQVRTDADGNAMTKADVGVSTELIGPIASGTSDLVLSLGG